MISSFKLLSQCVLSVNNLLMIAIQGNRAEQGESDMPSVPTESLIECGVCNLKRPRSAVHCYECGLCVDEVCFLSIVFIFIFMLLLIIVSYHDF